MESGVQSPSKEIGKENDMTDSEMEQTRVPVVNEQVELVENTDSKTQGTVRVENDRFSEISKLAAGRVIVFDTETTGLSSRDEIVELGAVEVRKGVLTGLQFHSYVASKRYSCQEALKVHGLSPAVLLQLGALSAEDVLRTFLEWVGCSPLVGHNVAFDIRMLQNELKRLANKEALVAAPPEGDQEPMKVNGDSKITKEGVSTEWNDALQRISRQQRFCTQRFYRSCFPTSKATLDDACRRFQIDDSARKRFHGALVDAKLTARVFCCLASLPATGARQPRVLPVLQKDPFPEVKEQMTKSPAAVKSEQPLPLVSERGPFADVNSFVNLNDNDMSLLVNFFSFCSVEQLKEVVAVDGKPVLSENSALLVKKMQPFADYIDLVRRGSAVMGIDETFTLNVWKWLRCRCDRVSNI